MAEHDRQLGRPYLPIAEVEISATDAAGADLEQQLPGAGLRVAKHGRLQRLPLAFEDHRAHRHDDAAPVFRRLGVRLIRPLRLGSIWIHRPQIAQPIRIPAPIAYAEQTDAVNAKDLAE
jgi:hypothetical protein